MTKRQYKKASAYATALWVMLVLAGAGCSPGSQFAASAAAEASTADAVVVSGSMLPTDGMLTKKETRRLTPRPIVRRARPQTADQGVWLFDYVARLLDTEPKAARRPRTAQRKPAAAAQTLLATQLPLAAPAPAAKPGVPVRAVPGLVFPVPATSPVTTGSVAPLIVPAAAGNDADQIIVAAEKSQLRADLIKLEFAARTYDEEKLSGQRVFIGRDDWRVLERAHDALNDAERASASIAGFEANAYINETTRTIVVAVAGSQDLKRDFLAADIWRALVQAQSPQHFYLAKTYAKSVIQRFQANGYSTECVGHSLGGGACAYVAAELGIRAIVLNPISAGHLAPAARTLVTNYVVDGEIAHLVYGARGNPFPGETQVINDGRDVIRLMALEKYGQLAGPILVVRELRAGIDSHKVDHALDLIAAQAETQRVK